MVVVDRVRSTQMEQNQMELDRYPAMKRILEEYSEIESNPSDDFKCGLLERNPYEWQFGIRGASGTEFEGGIYHGRIRFPEEYPSKPPSLMLLTENGRFKTKTEIGIKRLKHWGVLLRTVRDLLSALTDEMATFPDGALGSVEYNMDERRYLAVKSREAAPRYGNSERQKVIDEIHEYMLSKAPPVPQLRLSSPSQASKERDHSQNNGAKRKHGTGDTGGGGPVYNIRDNTFYAINSNGVGIVDSMKEASDQGPNSKKAKIWRFWW